jgi:hypothetical protein
VPVVSTAPAPGAAHTRPHTFCSRFAGGGVFYHHLPSPTAGTVFCWTTLLPSVKFIVVGKPGQPLEPSQPVSQSVLGPEDLLFGACPSTTTGSLISLSLWGRARERNDVATPPPPSTNRTPLEISLRFLPLDLLHNPLPSGLVTLGAIDLV